MIFKILSIAYGWFEVDFNREFVLINTGVFGNDAPYLLLEALCDLLESKSSETWHSWQHEPGAYILHLEKRDDTLMLKVYDTDKESEEFYSIGTEISKYITDCVYKTESPILDTAKAIYEEFELYEYGIGRKRYDVHWGGFPKQPYYRLRKLVRTK